MAAYEYTCLLSSSPSPRADVEPRTPIFPPPTTHTQLESNKLHFSDVAAAHDAALDAAQEAEAALEAARVAAGEKASREVATKGERPL